MVDSNKNNANVNKSLSADSELNSAYEYLKNNDLKQCKKTIDKRFAKLKSIIDKTNFNILKLLLFHKQLKNNEMLSLKNEIIEEIKRNKDLNTNENLIVYFNKILREINCTKDAGKLFKEIYISNKKIENFNNEQIKFALKEFIYNNEFNDLYQFLNKVTIYLSKNKDKLISGNEDNNYYSYLAMKYESLYLMAYVKNQINIRVASFGFKELENNFDKLKDKKGFYDIYLKYLLNTENYDKLTTICCNIIDQNSTSNIAAFANNILLDVYLKQNNKKELFNLLAKTIEKNVKQSYYVNFERIVNCSLYWSKDFLFSKLTEDNQYLEIVKFKDIFSEIFTTELNLQDNNKKQNTNNNINKNICNYFTSNNTEENYLNTIDFNKISNCNLLLSISKYFCYLFNQYVNESNCFNTFKSSSLSLLLIMFNLSKYNKNNYLFSNEAYIILSQIIKKISTKQSVLNEIYVYFVLLDNNKRLDLINVIDIDNAKNKNNLGEILLYYKLKCILDINCRNLNMATILINLYEKYSLGINKPEKGERLDYDDLIILINEIVDEIISKDFNKIQLDYNQLCINSKNSINFTYDKEINKLKYSLLLLNTFSHNMSEYNYDITIKYMKSCLEYNNTLLFTSLNLLKYMNLKGPLYETCSYINFNNNINLYYKPAINYYTDNHEHWLEDQKTGSSKALWKLFSNNNYQTTDEIINFEQDSYKSYLTQVSSTLTISKNFNEKFSLFFDIIENNSPKNLFEDDLINLFNDLKSRIESFINNKNCFIKNQDMFINMNKYNNIENSPYNEFELNNNSKDKVEFNKYNMKYDIDVVNKNNNIFYLFTPSKNNNYIQKLDNNRNTFGALSNIDYIGVKYYEEFMFNLIFYKRQGILTQYNQNIDTYDSEYSQCIERLKHNIDNNQYQGIDNWLYKVAIINYDIYKLYVDITKNTPLFTNYKTDTSKKIKDILLINYDKLNNVISKYSLCVIKLLLNSVNLCIKLDHKYLKVETIKKLQVFCNFLCRPLLFMIKEYSSNMFYCKKDLDKDFTKKVKDLFNENIKEPLNTMLDNIINNKIVLNNDFCYISDLNFIKERDEKIIEKIISSINYEDSELLKNVIENCKHLKARIKNIF